MIKARLSTCEVVVGSLRKDRRANEVGYSWHGELLQAAEEAGFEVLLTTDKNLAYQQNLRHRKIAIVVLGRNRWSMVKSVIPQIVSAVNAASPGSYSIVDVPAARL